jgi:carbonic anhydrase
MQKIIKGIHQFQANVFSSQRDLFTRLANSQSPDALFITCSDSRIDPSLITQTDPGDLFILRNAGNLIPPHAARNGGEAATIEFAVTALGVRDIIICGHSQCGAIKSLLDPATLTELPIMAAWLRHAEPTWRIVCEQYKELTGEQLLIAAIKENVLVQLEHLRTYPCIARAIDRGTLNLHGWIYEIHTGRIYSYDHAVRQFVPISEAPQNPIPSAVQLTPEHSI